MNQPSENVIARRKLLVALGTASAAYLVLPNRWEKPLSHIGVIPSAWASSPPSTPGTTGTGKPMTVTSAIDQTAHKVGVTMCPQKLGTITVTNTEDEEVLVGAAATKPVSIMNNMLTLKPGESGTFTVYFDCSQQTSFTSDVILTTTGKTTNAMYTTPGVRVTLNISS